MRVIIYRNVKIIRLLIFFYVLPSSGPPGKRSKHGRFLSKCDPCAMKLTVPVTSLMLKAVSKTGRCVIPFMRSPSIHPTYDQTKRVSGLHFSMHTP